MESKYTIRELARDEFFPLFERHKHLVFGEAHSYFPNDLLTDAELHSMQTLAIETTPPPYNLFLGVFDDNDELAGWSWGEQENSTTFYMVNSAVLPVHRRKGLYGELLAKSIGILADKGLQIIYSRHCATNNAVIIPKLRAGFIISAMEIDDKYGVLVHLRFYTNGGRRRVMDYRSGERKPDENTKKIFGL